MPSNQPSNTTDKPNSTESDPSYVRYLYQFLEKRSKRLYETCDELDDEVIARKLQIIQTAIHCLQAVPHSFSSWSCLLR